MKSDNNIEEQVETIFTQIINDFDGGWNTREHHVATLMALIKAEYNRGYAEGYTVAYETHS